MRRIRKGVNRKRGRDRTRGPMRDGPQKRATFSTAEPVTFQIEESDQPFSTAMHESLFSVGVRCPPFVS